MKTIAYVDGYNFYHGLLKRNPGYKWLDLRALLDRVLRIQAPGSELIAVRFFTSNIKAAWPAEGRKASMLNTLTLAPSNGGASR